MGRVRTLTVSSLCATLWMIMPGGAPASPMTFTDRADFVAALAGPATTVGFDCHAPGTIIGDGGSVGGITFNYHFGGVQLKLAAAYPTTSPTNFLGSDDADILQDGDNVSLSFVLSNAIGVALISNDPLEDGELLQGGHMTIQITTSSQPFVSR